MGFISNLNSKSSAFDFPSFSELLIPRAVPLLRAVIALSQLMQYKCQFHKTVNHVADLS